MPEATLDTLFRGRLNVKIKGLGEYEVGYESLTSPKLWDYLGDAYMMLSKTTEMVMLHADEWKIIKFSPEEHILEVEKVA